ncbi:histidine phosphatase family protein [Ornithinimicrobium panacihumi]|uniref:histidine phosphatase family protein n=1 Tax=Ornithinimicrobium panacihumi TaxID=2008449 RepID=UPI003F8BF75C
MRLLLIRHAQTPNNVIGALDTAAPGAGLTALGRAQARALTEALKDERVDGIYVSPLVRTRLTAEPLAAERGLPARTVPGLEEISAGDLEMRSDEESVLAYVTALIAWVQGDLSREVPGGSDGHAFLERYDHAVAQIAAAHGPGQTAAVFSHGAAIRAYAAIRSSLDPQHGDDLRIMNTGMGVLEGDPAAGWRLTDWRSEPVGGHLLADELADDVTGESPQEVVDGDAP